MNKKKILSLAVAVILLAILSFSTLAWFSDSDAVKNDFVIAGGENQNPDEIFSVDVMEYVVDENGKGATIGYDQDANYTDTFTYQHIAPGALLRKQPQIRNTGAYEQWVRMKVTFDNAEYWVALMQKYGYADLTDLLFMKDKATKLKDASNWSFAPEQTTVENNQVTYVFYYNTKLQPVEDNPGAAESNAIFFSYVKIPYQFTQQDVAPFVDGQFQMVVTGEAIQVKNLDADNAKAAFAIVEADHPIG